MTRRITIDGYLIAFPALAIVNAEGFVETGNGWQMLLAFACAWAMMVRRWAKA